MWHDERTLGFNQPLGHLTLTAAVFTVNMYGSGQNPNLVITLAILAITFATMFVLGSGSPMNLIIEMLIGSITYRR